MREVGFGIQQIRQQFMQGELLAVVEGHRLDLLPLPCKRFKKPKDDFLSLLVFRQSDQGVAALVLHHGHQHHAARPAYHGVHFPVADPAALFDDGRTLVDHHLVLDPAPAFAPGSALTIGFAAVPQMFGSSPPARPFVPIDILKDRLVADLANSGLGKGRADLLGIPLLFMKLDFHLLQKFRGDPQSPPFAGFAMTLGRDVTVIIPPHAIATQFARDRRGRNPDDRGNLFLRRTVAFRSFDGVTLLASQAVVGGHYRSAWSLNRKPLTVPGPLPTQPIALAA